MKEWLLTYFKELLSGVEGSELLEINRVDGVMVSVFRVCLPHSGLLDASPRFMKTIQGVVAAAGRSENRRYVIELEERKDSQE